MKRTCENCGMVFEDTREQLDVEQKFEENFPNEDREDCAVICDTCYPIVMNILKDMGLI